MNSGCAVVASHIIGSVPFLIKDGENGMIYTDGNIDDLYIKVKGLLDNPQKRKQIGIQAYKTLTEQWNAENAVQRFLQLVENISNDGKGDLFDTGVCSKAQILKENWYKKF
jgi:glycosyltransferase involved in cell wall biosynthesis